MNVTEAESLYDNLEHMMLKDVLLKINQEDQKVSKAVNDQLNSIENFVTKALDKIRAGGRLFYIGAGTSGRLGVLDASECPPTFGVNQNTIIGIIAGGVSALRIAKEGAEDDLELAWKDLCLYDVSKKDVVLGIASSGKTPYVLGGLSACKSHGILTGALVCNPNSPIAEVANLAIEVIVGPEFITGSTRMKAGTAQKMTLNMISTAIMIQLGKVKGNKMVDMKLSNDKLRNRAEKMLIKELGISLAQAKELLGKYGNVRKVIDKVKK